jgi:RNA polymerase sigma-70 factor (ECF subfamily)
MRRIADGDQNAFREIFEQFSPKVYAFALKLTQSDVAAEEIVQEVFMKVWINRGSLVSINYFPSYIYTITRNLAFNALKHLSIELKVKARLIKDQPYAHCETEETVIYHDYQNILKRAIDGLPPQQKLVYGLCHGEGLKYEEAAQRLHISRLTVKTHMQQALRTIKSHFNHLIQVCLLIAFGF